jgi:mannose/cellobiose epimerase-like protein (N-acyl-D-glucosamine 2-epimerase family)
MSADAYTDTRSGLEVDFRDVNTIRKHMTDCIEFYHRSGCIDPNGGFFQYFKDDCEIYNTTHRHLVSSARFVFVNAVAATELKDTHYTTSVEHGLQYLRTAHRNSDTGGYAWTLEGGEVEDATYHCYGVAFVLLAYSAAFSSGMTETREYIEETWELLER